jgi:hypothetical protein
VRLCLAFGVVVFFLPAVAFAQLSPGPLSRSHQGLEGSLQCGSCHTFGMGRAQLKCVSCHMDIQQRLKTNRGYHARVVDGQKGDSDCARCHAEHAGRDFALIRWPGGISRFDHRQAGYVLEGKHAALACAQCHTTKSFLTLKTDCTSCHKDEHQGQLGTQCQSCHTQAAWKPVTQLDHSKTRFALTGLHGRVACERCHTPEKQGMPVRFKGLAFGECSNCHLDPHKGSFEGTCQQCHDTRGWRVTSRTVLANFDHSRTAYPLTGRHSAVACGGCHKSSNFSAPVRSAKCIDCHADQHSGQFTSRPSGIECSACHNVDGFKPAKFDLRLHATTRYPLIGKHAVVACSQCHEPKGLATNYHPNFESCMSCHKDAHAGQFGAKYGNTCESCHSVNGFRPSTFVLARHGDSRFPLAGAHAAIACSDCHHNDPATGSTRYSFADRTCVACHRDPHDLDTAGTTRCETCHNVRMWTAVAAFDHTSTRFPLSGAHRAVACLSCHKPTMTNAAGRKVPFKGTSNTCAGCHEDVHAGQFATRPGTDGCASCHNTARWTPTKFDHASTRFPLDGAHQKVSCVACHTHQRQVSGRQVRVYASAPQECAQCH